MCTYKSCDWQDTGGVASNGRLQPSFFQVHELNYTYALSCCCVLVGSLDFGLFCRTQRREQLQMVSTMGSGQLTYWR